MKKAVHKAVVRPMQAQLAEERGSRGALEAEARTAREAARALRASAHADVERLRERLRAAEQAAEASDKSEADIRAQLQVRTLIPLNPSLLSGTDLHIRNALHSSQAWV